MRKILRIISLIFFLTGFVHQAKAEEGNHEWMDSSLTGILNFISGCIEVPRVANMVYSSKVLNLTQSEQWVPTGTYVKEGRLLQIEWDLRGVEPRPEKYLVLYRIDPRFKSPQVYIQQYDYKDKKYISDFKQFKNGQLLKYQETPEMVFHTRVQDYLDYFNFVSRSKIPVKVNDVINITLDGAGIYFAGNAEMSTELTGPLSNPAILYTESAGVNNKIIYSDLVPWCTAISNIGCSLIGYINPLYVWSGLVGEPINSSFDLVKSSISACPEGANTRANSTLCGYDKGRGMKLQVGAKTIKPTSESFIRSPYTNKDFFYYKSDTAGDLNFVTDWEIQGMFTGVSQFLDSWVSIADYDFFGVYLNILAPSTFMRFLHFGRYEMEVEIGNAEAVVSVDQLKDIKVEYVIMESGTPTDATPGNDADTDYKANANGSGYLWLRVINPNSDIGGGINVKLANYTGSTWFSDIVYGKLVKPLREKFNELTKQVYSKLVANSMLQNVARGMLTLYVMIYGLAFLAGAVQISAMDLIVRILKVIIILILFSNTSWNFFNDNLFTIFIDGTDYLLSNIVGVTSQVGNIFGFVDPIFDKYTNGTIWGLLFIQLLMIHNGMCFFAIITIYSILLYFRSLLEVIISYCLAFLGMAIMVSLAPIFITFLLFEQTKNMFNSWISTLFSYMMQPTILLIFFLLIDQLMGEHITKTVARACWDILVPIEIGLDLHFMGIPLSFSFSIPFLPGIPFYVGQIHEINSLDDLLGRNDGTFLVIATSSLLFYAYSKLAYGLVDYVTIVVQNLTNVVAARTEGQLQTNANPVRDIAGDMRSAVSPVTDRLEEAAGFIKRKVVDQQIDNRKPGQESGSSSFSSSAKIESGASSADKSSGDTIRQGGDKPDWKTTKPTYGSSAGAPRPFDAKGVSVGGAGGGRQAANTLAQQRSSGAAPQTSLAAKPNAPKPLPKPPSLVERAAKSIAPKPLPKPPSLAERAAKSIAPKPLPTPPSLAERAFDNTIGTQTQPKPKTKPKPGWMATRNAADEKKTDFTVGEKKEPETKPEWKRGRDLRMTTERKFDTTMGAGRVPKPALNEAEKPTGAKLNAEVKKIPPKPLPIPPGQAERKTKPDAPKPLPTPPGLAEEAAMTGVPKPLPTPPGQTERIAKIRAKMAEAETPKVGGVDTKQDVHKDTRQDSNTNTWSALRPDKASTPPNWPSEGDNKTGDKAADTSERTEMNLKESQKEKDNIQVEKPKQDTVSDKSGDAGQAGTPQPAEKNVSRSDPAAKPVNKDGNKNE